MEGHECTRQKGTQALIWMGKWCEQTTEKRSIWLVSTGEVKHGG